MVEIIFYQYFFAKHLRKNTQKKKKCKWSFNSDKSFNSSQVYVHQYTTTKYILGNNNTNNFDGKLGTDDTMVWVLPISYRNIIYYVNYFQFTGVLSDNAGPKRNDVTIRVTSAKKKNIQ